MKIAKDKVLHFAVCLVTALTVAPLTLLLTTEKPLALATGWAAAFVAGMAKELRDEHSYKGADEKDWLADILGATAGTALIAVAMYLWP
ncbi:MAG: hypothetical protein IJ588_03815 [Prevotella sp.]|nr:hypothetical protein [Prevotella sp.]